MQAIGKTTSLLNELGKGDATSTSPARWANLEKEVREASHDLFMMTDDGSYGGKDSSPTSSAS